MYKVKNNLVTKAITDIFTKNEVNSYYLRSISDVLQPQVRTELKGENSIRYLEPLVWDIVPPEIRHETNFQNWNKIEARRLSSGYAKITYRD